MKRKPNRTIKYKNYSVPLDEKKESDQLILTWRARIKDLIKQKKLPNSYTISKCIVLMYMNWKRGVSTPLTKVYNTNIHNLLPTQLKSLQFSVREDLPVAFYLDQDRREKKLNDIIRQLLLKNIKIIDGYEDEEKFLDISEYENEEKAFSSIFKSSILKDKDMEGKETKIEQKLSSTIFLSTPRDNKILSWEYAARKNDYSVAPLVRLAVEYYLQTGRGVIIGKVHRYEGLSEKNINTTFTLTEKYEDIFKKLQQLQSMKSLSPFIRLVLNTCIFLVDDDEPEIFGPSIPFEFLLNSITNPLFIPYTFDINNANTQVENKQVEKIQNKQSTDSIQPVEGTASQQDSLSFSKEEEESLALFSNFFKNLDA